jgi:glycine/D-amino acid oxidase-like deaminating enzyme
VSADLVVVGAGVMGAWTALRALEAGRTTTLIDAFGPGDPRATSGDESRIIRSSHGTDGFYAEWARAARQEWIELGEAIGAPIFEPCGVAWFSHADGGFETQSDATLRQLGIPVERIPGPEAVARWPGLALDADDFVVHEPEGGLLRARQGVRAVAARFQAGGGMLRVDRVRPAPGPGRRLETIETASGESIGGGTFVFAAGPWLAKLFPEALGDLIALTKQDVFYFGPEPGDRRFDADRFPAWVDFDRAMYGIPAVDGRGFKAAPDGYGRAFDPDTEDRLVDRETLAATRTFLADRVPAMAARPLVETRVCQYESTPDTHFVIDRHPDWDNVWLVGGGSGHGFKHGPSIGRYVLDLIDAGGSVAPIGSGPPDNRFSLSHRRVAGPTMRSGGPPPIAQNGPGAVTR